MSIATEIQRLQQAKADIKSAIEEKGVTVGDGTIDTFASKIAEITGGGGGIPTGYKTVTFMNGDKVEFERLVLSGDDCPDPVTQGRIETPTKESTPQYNYTHSGWTSVDGGTANSNVLKNITEDKVVYSAYTKTIVEYTITYYDEDGVTVLHTEQLGYGSVPNYMPTKDDFTFDKWTPTPTVVTGDASYIASWTSVLASGTCGDAVRWSLSTDYTLTISGTGDMSDYAKSADVPWKSYASQIVAVTILDGVTSICDEAFYGCTNLVDVEIADSVTHIGNMSFYSCSALTSITLPDSIASIDYNAFYNCTNLTDVHISDIATWCNINLVSYETYVLYTGYGKTPRNLYINGVLATDIVIPDSVTNIKQYAFAYCSTLTSITIPDSVTSIGASAFSKCTSLESVDIADSVTSIGTSAFNDCSSLTGVIIPNSVTSIGATAFSSCTSLTSITIPDSVTSIGRNVVSSTAYFKDTNNWDNGVLYIGNHLISAKTSITGAYIVKADVRTIAANAFSNCTSLTSVDMPNSIVGIGEQAFYSCTSLTSINVNNSTYVSINGILFDKECTTLITYPAGKIETEFNIPDSVTSIGDYAFEYCTNLTSVTIPDNVTSIAYHAFGYCSGLTSIIIPDSVTNIGEYAFYQCTGLESVTIGSGVTSISRYMCGYCSGLTSITIPNTITRIAEQAFSNCTGLTSATFVDTNGWRVVHSYYPLETPTKIYASNLTTSNAAKLLRSTYAKYIWTKS